LYCSKGLGVTTINKSGKMNGSFKKQLQCQTEPQFAQVVYAEKESISQDFFFF